MNWMLSSMESWSSIWVEKVEHIVLVSMKFLFNVQFLFLRWHTESEDKNNLGEIVGSITFNNENLDVRRIIVCLWERLFCEIKILCLQDFYPLLFQ